MILELLGLAAAAVGVPLVVYDTWGRLVVPRLRRTKLRRFHALVEQWFDEIDRSLERGVYDALVANLEDKISAYLRDQRLETVRMQFTKRFRVRFLRRCGLKAELCSDPELFRQFARVPATGIDLKSWWQQLMGLYYRFIRNYRTGSPDTNFADVKMSVLLLKMYVGARSE